ncbi:MAG: sensor histidine kinase [Propionibacterium acidifaciens]
MTTIIYMVAVTGLMLCYPSIQKSVVVDRIDRPWSVASVLFIVAILATEGFVSSVFFDAVVVVALLFLTSSDRRRVAAVGTAVLVEIVLLCIRPYTVTGKAVLVCLNAVVGVVLLTFALLARTLVELEVSKEQLARLSVDEERSRISRDLHDIIGRTLVAVSLRQEAALNLLDRDVGLARRQLVASGETVREGQAQLRALTHGPVMAGVEDELRSARALCERIGVRLVVEAEPVEGDADAECALVLREGITNMLKHADARTCWVGVRVEDGRAVVSVVNDGVVGGRPMGRDGSGVGRMRRRVVLRGGSLEAGPVEGGRFGLRAEIPLVGAQ